MDERTYSRLVDFPQAQFQSLDIRFNDWDEMVISAVDMNGNQVGGCTITTPPKSFLLLFNPQNSNWLATPNMESIEDYQIVKCVMYAE